MEVKENEWFLAGRTEEWKVRRLVRQNGGHWDKKGKKEEEGKKMKLILSTIHDGLTMRWEFEIITGDDDDLSHHV